MQEGGRRAAALVAAALMVTGALAARSFLDDDSGGGGGSSAPLTLTCPPDLARVCDDAELDDVTVVVEDAATTAEHIATAEGGDDLEADLWLVPRPWAEATEAQRAGQRLDPLVEDGPTPGAPVASSPVVLVIWEDRAEVLESGPCGGTLTWQCIGDAAEGSWEEVGGPAGWGRVRAGITDPATGNGIVVLGALTADQLGTTDFHPNDVGREVERWLDRVEASSTHAGPPDAVDSMLTRGEGYLAALGTTRAAATRAQGRDDLRVERLAPELAVELVVTPLNDGAVTRARQLADDGPLADALGAAGWDPPDDVDAVAPPPGPVLHALLETWRSL